MNLLNFYEIFDIIMQSHYSVFLITSNSSFISYIKSYRSASQSLQATRDSL